MQKEEIPSPFAIAGGALVSIWFGVMIAGMGLVFTPVIDNSVKAKATGSATKKDPKKDPKADADPLKKTFAEGNLNAPFFTYERGEEKAGSNWKSLLDNIMNGKPADFKEMDLNTWFLNLPSNTAKDAGGITVTPERANFRLKDNEMTVSAWISVSEMKIPFGATGNFSGSGRSFKIASGHLGSCPLPGFLTGLLMGKFSPDTSKYKPILDLKEAWPKFTTVSIEGDTLKIIP